MLAEEDPEFSKSFVVDFRQLEYIGNDLSKLLPNQVELLVFRITPFQRNNKQEYWTTKAQLIELQKAQALQILQSEEAIEKRSMYRNQLKELRVDPEGMIDRMCVFVTRTHSIKVIEQIAKDKKNQIQKRLEELEQLKQDPVAELRAKIAQRKQQIAEKKQKLEDTRKDIKDLTEVFQLKRCREFDTCAARFNAYAEKLSKEIKMDKDNW